MAEHHRLHEVPPVAAHPHWPHRHGGVAGGHRRRLLPQRLPHVRLPVGHVLRDRRPRLLHHLRLLRHREGLRPPVMNRAYPDYSLQDYSGSWLADRVSSPAHWAKISDCLRASHACRSLHRNVGGVPELADRFYRRKLTPIQVITSYLNRRLKSKMRYLLTHRL